MPHIRLPIDVRSVLAARTLLHGALHEHGVQTRRPTASDTVGSAVLMLSELVTNAIRHTRDLLLLEITIQDDRLHVAVVDDAPGLPALRRRDDLSAHGRGLAIVDALADRWGVDGDADRKAVWFEIALCRGDR